MVICSQCSSSREILRYCINLGRSSTHGFSSLIMRVYLCRSRSSQQLIQGTNFSSRATAEMSSTLPTGLDGSEGEDQGCFNRHHQACSVFEPAGGGKHGVLSTEGCIVSNVRAAQCGISRAVRTAGVEVRDFIRESADFRLKDPPDNVRRGRKEEHDWFSADKTRAIVWRCGAVFRAEVHDHPFYPELRLGKWYLVLFKECELDEIGHSGVEKGLQRRET